MNEVVNEALAKAKALLDAVDFDNNGAMIAGHLQGGNGGLISRDTIKAADALRLALDAIAQMSAVADTVQS